jgi:UDP-glucuronate 4-epimerase
MKILVTGAAGFIGFHAAQRLLAEGHEVVGFDNVNDYYDVGLKNARLDILRKHVKFNFHKNSLEDKSALDDVFRRSNPQRVLHLAAQPGVRYSLKRPEVYIQSNVVGFLNILEGCRNFGVEHLVYASTSSVYGLNADYPFAESQNTDHPASLYAATKKADELMAHAYSHLFAIPATGLRFFTVYGPWGRPDMAFFLFTKKILAGEPIDVYNQGEMVRDFTYIDDIVEGTLRVLFSQSKPDDQWSGENPDPGTSSASHRVYNIGSNNPVPLMDFIREIEKNLGTKAQLNFMPMQPGDIHTSHADVARLIRDFDYKPAIDYKVGIRNFVAWYADFYKIKLPPKTSA